jgi:hypothetical protein
VQCLLQYQGSLNSVYAVCLCDEIRCRVHGIDGVKVREQMSTKSVQAQGRHFLTGAAFSAVALDSGINPKWQKREAWLLLGGAGTAGSLSDLSNTREYVIHVFPIHPYHGNSKRN